MPLTKRIELEENVYKTQGALFGSVIGARIEKPNLIAPPKEKDELDLIEPYEDPDEKKPGLEVPKAQAQEDQGGSQPEHSQGNVERVSHIEGPQKGLKKRVFANTEAGEESDSRLKSERPRGNKWKLVNHEWNDYWAEKDENPDEKSDF